MPHEETIMTITVSVNGTAQVLPAGSTLAQLLERLDRPPQQVATAVNGDFVARVLRAERVLNDGDQIQCFQPIGGG
jgi:sulfur carrier protein